LKEFKGSKWPKSIRWW